MKTMTNENFRHICRLVEQKTGVSLGPDRMPERRHRARLVPLLAALAVNSIFPGGFTFLWMERLYEKMGIVAHHGEAPEAVEE